MKLYAIKNIRTGKLVTNITNPSHKFWENRQRCENALRKYQTSRQFVNWSKQYDLINNYKVVTFELKEVEE